MSFPWETDAQNASAAVAGPTSGDGLDYVIEGDIESTADANQIEKEAADREFSPPPPGDYTFKITGFMPLKDKTTNQPLPIPYFGEKKTGYFQGALVEYFPGKLGVKLAVVGQENLSMVEWVQLPPKDVLQRRYWQGIMAKSTSHVRDSGFMCRRLEQFIQRLGFDWTKGTKLPVEAATLRNWIDLEINATVEMGKVELDMNKQPKVNPMTNEPLKPQPQLKLFSFRYAESTLANLQDRPKSTTSTPALATSVPSGQSATIRAAMGNI